eukprot:scaffold8252_cov92-Cylindrotheca_fusiformis.AAC.5
MDDERISSEEDGNEELFLEALKSLREGVRFSTAGFYTDSIQSLLEGFQTLEVLLGTYGVKLNKEDLTEEVCFPISDTAVNSIQVDGNPIDGNFENRKEMEGARTQSGCPCPYHYDLLLAMIYNLGLAYHLYALEEQRTQDFTAAAALNESFNLYKQAKRLLQNNDSKLMIHRSLENNLHHVFILLHTTYHAGQEIQRQPLVKRKKLSM